ncbi:hypothetical protein QUR76_03110 [Arcobacter cryaerophilus gv. pseudocryaerophilus]|uniref:Transformation system protein n=3 Tax=unclassified Arcobacter TaxID=2593671 RepID=A0AA96DIU9_9BACT|nr:hypothetical protein RMQ65_04985 [Arcobacter sp. AZ-2023]WPD06187.1 hypothetical protein QUR76_03110 [Arcobacter sp. DSM 115956]WPD08278.1 hypothetical protein QUR78_03110 [Arcobacter sp. DSM 115955]WNL32543.1 hypothetical protein RMQ67_03110 [Arcobacter sp. AZ-2023]WNP38693.1 hypothetical protein RJG58_03110 [Arcobacter sp. AZ-2023]
MLANFKNSFENSSLKTKIELYLLPILLLFFCYVLFYNEKIEENQNVQNSELLNIENKKFTDSILELSNKIEDIAKSENLIIQKTQISKEQIIIQLKGKRDYLLNFLEKVEEINRFTKIDFLSLKKFENEIYLIDVTVDVSKYYLKNKKVKDIINIEQEEINQTKEDEHKEEIIVRPDFKINAIVGNNTFINDSWFELNDEVLGYKIETIANDYVILQNNKDIIKLEVNSIEYFKNKN